MGSVCMRTESSSKVVRAVPWPATVCAISSCTRWDTLDGGHVCKFLEQLGIMCLFGRYAGGMVGSGLFDATQAFGF